MKKTSPLILPVLCLIALQLTAVSVMAQQASPPRCPCIRLAVPLSPAPVVMQEAYPLLSGGPLSHAVLADLPPSMIFRSGTTTLTAQEIEAELVKMPEAIRPQFSRMRITILERIVVRSLLSVEATAWAERQQPQPLQNDTEKLLQAYLQSLLKSVDVSEEEIAQFYKENRDMVGGIPLEQVKPQVRQYLLDQKKQESLTRYVNSISQRTKVELDRPWFQSEYQMLIDNPVDKVRLSGKPSLVDFGAAGCVACDMMAPLLKSLKQQYDGKANVIVVDVRDEQALATRFGIQSIPVQVFFDEQGREVFRHVGAFSGEQMKTQLANMGVK